MLRHRWHHVNSSYKLILVGFPLKLVKTENSEKCFHAPKLNCRLHNLFSLAGKFVMCLVISSFLNHRASTPCTDILVTKLLWGNLMSYSEIFIFFKGVYLFPKYKGTFKSSHLWPRYWDWHFAGSRCSFSFSILFMLLLLKDICSPKHGTTWAYGVNNLGVEVILP